jgi:hypothetical protein
MRHIAHLLSVFVLTSGGLLLAAPDRDEAGAKQSAATVETSKRAVAQGKRRASKPASTFKPSEKIGADSAVSFPVDI